MSEVASAALRELPLGAVRPTGWLADQLRLQADGQTGRLPEFWEDVSASSAWLGGDGEAWENGPYHLDGLVPLAFVLDDEGLKERARTWVESIIASQRPNGQFGPVGNDDWWPRMVALKALTQWADATGDHRVERLLTSYFRYQAAELPGRPLTSWAKARGAENVVSVLWLHERTGEEWLLDLGRLLLTQTADWLPALTDDLPAGPMTRFSHLTHVVNTAMALKLPAVAARVGGCADASAQVVRMFEHLDRLHGQVHGMFSGDEWLAGRDARRGVETCAVVELMFTLEQLVRNLGEGRYGDRLEAVAFNQLAAANDPRMLAHQFVQQANQVLVSFGHREWTFSKDEANTFGPSPVGKCCTANLHQGWPKLVRSMWMAGPEEDVLTVVAYGPCRVSAQLGGRTVVLDVETSYPFDETVEVVVHTEPGRPAFGLRLRIPQWCTGATLTVAGEPQPVPPDEHGFLTVTREWTDGDRLRLVLPMQLRTVPRDGGAVGLRLGPLVLVHGVGEVWRPVPGHEGLGEWEITPRTAWHFGLWVEDPDGLESWPVTRTPVSSVPFAPGSPPVVVAGRGSMIEDWQLHQNSAGPVPASPVSLTMPVQSLRLVPYGSARLRVAEMPTVSVPVPRGFPLEQ